MEKKNPCIAMVPSLGLSHLIPLVEFAKRLVLHHHDFHVTFLIPTLGSPSPTMEAILEALPPTIDFTILPHVNLEDLPPDAHPATQILLTVTRSLPSLHRALSSLSSSTNLVALVTEIFSIDALEIAKQLNLPTYVYHASAVFSLSFCLYLPKLDAEMISSGFGELSEPVKFPGCIAFQGKDLPEPVQKKSSEAYRTILHMCKQIHLADAFIVNSFVDLEPEAIRALQENNTSNPPVYPVGPIIQNGSSSKVNELECLKWLDEQPHNSVLYVSFGSGGTLSHDQLNELAFGLELSGHKFLWVVRAPSESASSAYLSAQKEDPLEHLPNGFMERTNGQGLVVPSWAPQIEILRHGSTGGFLTHCGWNSTLESVVYGKPMIAWPLFAEQRMNAVMLTDEFKVAVRPKANETGIVEREEIAKVIKSLMEGDEGREIGRRIKVFKDAAAAALSEDGSSAKTISCLALKWKNLNGI